MSTTEPETAATETTPVLPQDLPGPAPEEGAAAVPVSGDAPHEGSPAAGEAAAGPGSQPAQGTGAAPVPEAEVTPEGAAGTGAPAVREAPPRPSLAELDARIRRPMRPMPRQLDWSDLWAAFDQAERDCAIGDNDDGRLLNAWYAQAFANTFPPRRAAVTA